MHILSQTSEAYKPTNEVNNILMCILYLINTELVGDKVKLEEVVHCWLESKRNPKWSDVAALCEDTGYNQISESLYNAYYTGECVEALTL